MKYDFDTIPLREETPCIKYGKRNEVFGNPDVIPMWIADMDFEVAPCITDAIKNRAEHAIYGYDFRNDDTIGSIIQWVARRNEWDIEPDWLMFTPGVVVGLVTGVLAFTKPGDGVVIQPPVYPPFAETIKSNGREVLNNPLELTENGFEINFEDLDDQLSRAKALMFCNPHNPTGRVFTREELLRVGELCIKHDVYIISDEIHSDLVYKPCRHIHIASLSPEIASRTVTLMAPSKSFNIAGLATSIAAASDPETRERYNSAVEKTHICSGNTFGNIAMAAAYRDGDQWLEQVLEYMRGNIDYVREFIAANMPKIKSYKTEGTYLMWLDFAGLEMTCNKLSDFIINKAGLGLNDGRQFGEQGCRHMRMNVATSRSVIEQAMKQLLEAYNSCEQTVE